MKGSATCVLYQCIDYYLYATEGGVVPTKDACHLLLLGRLDGKQEYIED
jgi:hypothetical protein